MCRRACARTVRNGARHPHFANHNSRKSFSSHLCLAVDSPIFGKYAIFATWELVSADPILFLTYGPRFVTENLIVFSALFRSRYWPDSSYLVLLWRSKSEFRRLLTPTLRR
jgi:hypothetical protein